MIRSLYTAATGMDAQSTNVDNTANNLANVNTTGFKRSELNFQDLVYLNLLTPGTEQLAGIPVPTGLQIGNGVRVAGTTKVFSQGTATNTSNPLDIEIDGDGFLQITYTDGTLRYSRDGALRLNANNQLVNTSGFQVSPTLTIPSDALSVSISTDGTVSVVTAGAPNTSTTVGQLTLARFPNPAGLSSQGNNLYAQSPASGAPITTLPGQNGAGLIRQGFLEGSNVDVVQELVNLIIAQRSYEFDTRAVRVSDEMLSTTNGLIQ